MLVYQAIKGNNTGIAGTFEDVEFPYLYVSSQEDYQAYKKYFEDQLPYTDDEIREMASMDMYALKSKAHSLSIEDVQKRLG